MITQEDKDKLIATLTLQLQEKDKEISVLKSQLCLSTISQNIDQDKILFAVERLEKVRSNILCNERFYFENLNKYIDETIDNQIEELKKEMK